MDHNSHFLAQASTCIGCNTCPVVGSNGFEHVCESTGGGYLSSDDEDDELCLHCASSINPICHAEETLVTKHCCSSANKSTARPSQDPSFKQKAKSNCNCQNETDAQTHNGNTDNSRLTQDAGTQTAAVPALSCQDVSVQCSLIHADHHSSSSSQFVTDQKTSVPATRRQSFHFNGLLTPTTGSSQKDGCTREGKIPLGASAKKEQAQRLPKSQIDFYFHKPQSQASMKIPPTPILGKTIIKASELKEEQQLESRMKIERCGGPQLESVTQNSVKDVRRAEEPVKEKNFPAERGANWVSEETKKLQEIADILLMLKQRKISSGNYTNCEF
ncbi:uncharacterized protein LOC127638673 [Xyrauchen texanus]|uniref:uncharacterized protein LOC127638673 n=1 Tax=Xyrauchen texanus TaxID=154827 RepID=UPI0022418899|nr:uncharacterized protein LOC127638673 [Xyrauchen texanus]